MVKVACMIGIAVGLFLWRLGKRDLDRLRKYEFEHRTDGGVVKFADYETSKWHARAKGKAAQTATAGEALGSLSAVVLVLALALDRFLK